MSFPHSSVLYCRYPVISRGFCCDRIYLRGYSLDTKEVQRARWNRFCRYIVSPHMLRGFTGRPAGPLSMNESIHCMSSLDRVSRYNVAYLPVQQVRKGRTLRQGLPCSLSTCPSVPSIGSVQCRQMSNPLPFSTIEGYPHLFKIVTPIKIDQFESLLATHPNKPFIESVCIS
jgi:hypothetical protein